MTAPGDYLGWYADEHGRMRDHATDDDTVTTEPFEDEDGDD